MWEEIVDNKDGLFYYPYPKNKRIRMYVRNNDGVIEFRLNNVDHPEIWEGHGWLDMDIIKRGAKMFAERGGQTDPIQIYDLETARYLLKEAQRKK